MNTFETLVELMSGCIPFLPPQIKKEHQLIEDLGLSSLDVLNLAGAIEDEWNIFIPDDDLYQMTSLADVLAYIEMRRSVV